MKFIPAGGTVTCMFKELYTYVENGVETDFIDHFFDHLESFYLYKILRKHINVDLIDKNVVDDRVYIIETLLNDEMNYGSLPKALIPFHRYDDRLTTPIDEHIFEGEHFLDADNVNLHFTIAEEAEDLFNAYIETATEGKNDINITYSFQKKKTNTVAADMDNNPFMLENGEVLYRPGGHGALIENLNDLEEDIIFIKNIDNVSHQS